MVLTPSDVNLLLPTDEAMAKQLMAAANRHILRGMVRGASLAWDTREVAKSMPRIAPIDKKLIDIPAKIFGSIKTAMAETWTLAYWQKVAASTRSMLQKTIQSGLAAHASTVEIAKAIASDASGIFSKKRAMTIARTEITSALNYGHYTVNQELADDEETAVIGKEWVSILDTATRQSHVKADGQVASAKQPFMVGGHPARFPGDPNLPAKERIHCRCTLVEAFEFDDD